MKYIQSVLNAILSKNIFEYILVDSDFHLISHSDGFKEYLDTEPKKDDDLFNYLPELVGSEDMIKEIFTKKDSLFSLESVHKNGYYVNISIEYYDEDQALLLLHNITETTLAQQKLLQYSNEIFLS